MTDDAAEILREICGLKPSDAIELLMLASASILLSAWASDFMLATAEYETPHGLLPVSLAVGLMAEDREAFQAYERARIASDGDKAFGVDSIAAVDGLVNKLREKAE